MPARFIAPDIPPGLSLCIQGTSAHISIPIGEERFIPVHTGNMLLSSTEYSANTGLSLCIQGT